MPAARASAWYSPTVVSTSSMRAMWPLPLSRPRKPGERLVVAVNSDDLRGASKARAGLSIPADRRMAVLAGLESVDWVVSFAADTPCELLRFCSPYVLVKGGDYAGSKQGVVMGDRRGAWRWRGTGTRFLSTMSPPPRLSADSPGSVTGPGRSWRPPHWPAGERVDGADDGRAGAG